MGEKLNMRVALICPSNILYMPYVGNYEKVLKENEVDYDIINWDRFKIEDSTDSNKYRDKKTGHQRNYFDYLGYRKFLLKKRLDNYDNIIVFGIQLSYFLKDILLKNFKGKYVIDIRDYNKILKFFNFKRVVDKSQFIVISSPGYKAWLPNGDKYVINHNTLIDSLELIDTADFQYNNSEVNISYIGSLANIDVNVELINSLANNDKFNLMFHGAGTINEMLEAYVGKNSIKNVIISGRYEKKEEKELYSSAHLINMLLYNKGINNHTCLANRVYNSVLFGKPMIALEGTYIAEQIKKYKLGLVLSSFQNIEDKIENYIKGFDIDEYNKGRRLFYNWVINDNREYTNKIKEFCSVP